MIPTGKNLAAALAASLVIAAAACGAPRSGDPEGLSASLILSATGEFARRWNAAPVGIPPEIPSIAKSVTGQPIYVGCIISGFAKDNRGFVNLRVDLEVIGPDGKTVLRQDGFAAYDRKPEPGRGTVMANSLGNLNIESSDPPGTYAIKATVTDLVSGKRAETRSTVAISREAG